MAGILPWAHTVLFSRIYMLFSMVIIGLSIGMQPIIGYNFGAGLTERVDKAMNTGLTIAFAFMFSMFLLCEIAADPIIRLFSNEIALKDIAITGLVSVHGLFLLCPCKLR